MLGAPQGRPRQGSAGSRRKESYCQVLITYFTGYPGGWVGPRVLYMFVIVVNFSTICLTTCMPRHKFARSRPPTKIRDVADGRGRQRTMRPTRSDDLPRVACIQKCAVKENRAKKQNDSQSTTMISLDARFGCGAGGRELGGDGSAPRAPSVTAAVDFSEEALSRGICRQGDHDRRHRPGSSEPRATSRPCVAFHSCTDSARAAIVSATT